jgi:hypothetical protein
VKIINQGNPKHKHFEKIVTLENGNEKGVCECGREVLYDRVNWDTGNKKFNVPSGNKSRYQYKYVFGS